MFLLIPYKIETFQLKMPWANWLILIACSLVFFLGGDYDLLVLDSFSLPGLFCHVLLHSGYTHLLGNMVFLWVFGNAVCTNTNNWFYLAVFVVCAGVSATVHLLLDGRPAVGASGAINGIVGIVFAIYPLNRVRLFWMFFGRVGSTSCPAFIIIAAWFIFDVWGASFNGAEVIAYWAHIGGFVTGVFIGLTTTLFGWFELDEFESKSLVRIVRECVGIGRKPESY